MIVMIFSEVLFSVFCEGDVLRFEDIVAGVEIETEAPQFFLAGGVDTKSINQRVIV